MKIYLHEITHLDTDLALNQDEKWLMDAVLCVDEHLPEHLDNPLSDLSPSLKAAAAASLNARPVSARFNLRRVDDVVVVSGDIDASVQLICSRCAASYLFHTHPKFSALFCKDPVMAGVAHLQRGDDRREPGRPVGQNHGFARHAHDESEDNAETASNVEITYIAEDHINLASVVTEQLQLQVPFQPLCRENCKGMCQSCGADLNVGRCACAKILKQSPFAVLSSFKGAKTQKA